MRRLAELQRLVCEAVVCGQPAGVASLLVGGRDPERRLAIHCRHYRASLVKTLLRRFPALTWLVGGPVIEAAASRYAREHPPATPCLAEYGEGFPALVADHLGRSDTAYVRPFGELEWHVGAASIEVEHPAMAPTALPRDGETLAGATVRLQPGLRYLHSEWPVHDLMRRFLTDTAPPVYELHRTPVWIEVRGARGRVDIQALDRAAWTFRAELQRGRTLEDAASLALAIDHTFDAGEALLALVAGGAVVELRAALAEAAK